MSYIQEISDLYISRRGGSLMLSPMDCNIIAEWEKQEIPLRIVLRSMEDVFDNLANSKKPIKIKSLEYFSETIDENYCQWLQNQVGKQNN